VAGVDAGAYLARAADYIEKIRHGLAASHTVGKTGG
jgi:hypothetical protein